MSIIRDIDFSKVAKTLSRETLSGMMEELKDVEGFSRTWDEANAVAIIEAELEARGENS